MIGMYICRLGRLPLACLSYAVLRVNKPHRNISSIAPRTAKIILGIDKTPADAAAAPLLPSKTLPKNPPTSAPIIPKPMVG